MVTFSPELEAQLREIIREEIKADQTERSNRALEIINTCGVKIDVSSALLSPEDVMHLDQA